MLLQQPGSFLRGYVESQACTGKQAVAVDQLGAVEAQTPAARFAPLVPTHASLSRPWLFPTDADITQWLDTFDMKRLLNSSGLQSKYQANAAAGMGRKIDDLILVAALGTTTRGVDPGTVTSETFDTTNFSVAADFGAGAEVGLTYKKLVEVDRKWEAADVNLANETKVLVIGPKQHSDLKNQSEFIHKDYGPPRLDQQGNILQFMGFNIIVSNRLTLVSDDRYCIAFLKSGMRLGIWDDINTSADQRKDLSGHPWQVYTKMTIGAARTEQGRVIRILADETV
jgi:hypothetical protein